MKRHLTYKSNKDFVFTADTTVNDILKQGINQGCSRNIEAVSMAYPYLSNFFKLVVSHCLISNIDELPEYSAYFMLTIPDVYRFNPIKTVEIEFDSEVNDCFWDYLNSDNNAEFFGGFEKEIDYNRVNLNGISIKFRGQNIGFLIPERQILFGTDWTHSNTDSTTIGAIISELQKKEILREIPIQEKEKRIVKLTMGADPEFEENTDWFEYHPKLPTVNQSIRDEIGTDAAGAQIEIRPRPSDNVEELVKNIKSLIVQLPPISDRGDRYPIGGHIHFGTRRTSDIITILDDFLGRKLLNLSGKARGSYGYLGAYEDKPWGFEYRTLPSCWLHNPEIAKLVLQIAQGTVKKFLEDGEITYEVTNNKGVADDEYLNFISLEERNKLFNFIDEYFKNTNLIKPINANWGATYKVSVFCTEDWNYEIKDIFCNRLQKNLEEKKLDEKVYSIIVYGLKEERGNVCTFPSKTYTRIEDIKPLLYEGRIYLGVPFIFRTEETDAIIRVVADEITEYLDTLLHDKKFENKMRISIIRMSGAADLTRNVSEEQWQRAFELIIEEFIKTLDESSKYNFYIYAENDDFNVVKEGKDVSLYVPLIDIVDYFRMRVPISEIVRYLKSAWDQHAD